MASTKASLDLEYGGYKAYAGKMLIEKAKQLSSIKRGLEAKLIVEKAKKYHRKKDITRMEKQIKEVDEKITCPLTVEDLLADKVVAAAFPTVRRLLKIYLLLPQSEAVVERGFSKMKLTMTKQRTSLDSKSLDALMRLSYRQQKFTDVEIHKILDIWKEKKDRRIFSSCL